MPLFIGCGYGKYEKIEKSLCRDTIISILSDSSLFGNTIEEITTDGNNLYFSDFNERHVVCLNPDFSLKGIIGRKGAGPEDLMRPSRFYKDSSSFYIRDDGANTLKVYSESGAYQRRIHFPADMTPIDWCRFVLRDSLIYFSSHTNSPVFAFDFEGKSVYRIGEISEEEPGGKTLQGDKEYLYTIGITQAIVERYSYKGVLQSQLDYSEVPFVKRIIENSRNTAHSFSSLVKDVFLEEGHLYLLILDRILDISLGEEMVLENIYVLPHGLYYTFCTYKGGFFIFNIKDFTFEFFSKPRES